MIERPCVVDIKAGERRYHHLDCDSCQQHEENPILLEQLSSRMGYTAIIDTLRAALALMP